MKPSEAQAEDLQEAEGVPPVPGNSPAFYEDVDALGLAGVAEKAGVRQVKRADADTHKREEALPVASAVPALARGTIGIEPTSGAEIAIAAKPETLG